MAWGGVGWSRAR